MADFTKSVGRYVDAPVIIHVKRTPPKILLEGRVIEAREKAIRLQNDHYEFRQWVPRSVIRKVADSIGPDAKEGDEGDLYVTPWYIDRLREKIVTRYLEKHGQNHPELPDED